MYYNFDINFIKLILLYYNDRFIKNTLLAGFIKKLGKKIKILIPTLIILIITLVIFINILIISNLQNN